MPRIHWVTPAKTYNPNLDSEYDRLSLLAHIKSETWPSSVTRGLQRFPKSSEISPMLLLIFRMAFTTEESSWDRGFYGSVQQSGCTLVTLSSRHSSVLEASD